MFFTKKKIYWLALLVVFSHSTFVFSISAANATLQLNFEDTRSRTVATLLAYKFLNSEKFYECAIDWLKRRSPVQCNDYVSEVSSIAKGVKNLKITSPKDEKFNQAISMYISASDAAWPYCLDWHNGHRPDVCFRLILNAIRVKWLDNYQKETTGNIISGKPVR